MDVCRFLHSVPSMMKIEVAPVSAIACDAVMVIVLRCCRFVAPNNYRAIAAIDCPVLVFTLNTSDTSCMQFVVTIVFSSLSTSAVALMIWVGSEVLA